MRLDLIGADELARYVAQRGYTIVDLRSRQEYMLSHIPGAVNMPYDHTDFKNLRENTTYIFYCERGVKSLKLCRYLAERGIHSIAVVAPYEACVKSL